MADVEEAAHKGRPTRAARREKMYDHKGSQNARGDTAPKPKVEAKPAAATEEAQPPEAAEAGAMLPAHKTEHTDTHARHEKERRDLHGAQRDEHRSTHGRHVKELAGAKDMATVHTAHQTEHKDMGTRHHKAIADMHAKHHSELADMHARHAAPAAAPAEKKD